jgi:hypothetical protein
MEFQTKRGLHIIVCAFFGFDTAYRKTNVFIAQLLLFRALTFITKIFLERSTPKT